MSSRRVSVLLVAMVVVVMALGIMSVLRAVSASPDNKDSNNDDKGRTLTVLTKTREAEVVDLGPPGPTHGDIRVANAPLYDAKGTNKIGRFDLFCVVTDPADESAEKYHMSECTYTFTLPGGEISVQGLNAFPKLAGLPPEGVDAISGGTGKHAGVEGELRHQTRANKVISTFHFID